MHAIRIEECLLIITYRDICMDGVFFTVLAYKPTT